MDGKIKVPEGMLKAATEHVDMKNYTGSVVFGNIKTGLEAALLWLSKNPIVPSDEQINKLWESWAVPLDPSAKGLGVYGPSRDQIRFTSIEWQRRMFFDHEPEVRPFVKAFTRAFQGVTLTTQEADYIVDEVSTVAHGWNRGQRSK